MASLNRKCSRRESWSTPIPARGTLHRRCPAGRGHRQVKHHAPSHIDAQKRKDYETSYDRVAAQLVCQVPFATDYIRKVQKRGAIGKKRKKAKC